MPGCDDGAMDPVYALTALGLLGTGAVLALAAVLCRAGPSRGARFWARTAGAARRGGHDYGEVAVLVVLPLIAQTLLVAGAVAGLLAVDLLRGPVAAVLVPFAVVAEVLVWAVLLVATGYRAIMPLWIYPAWLRPQRRHERDLIRSR